MLDATLPLPHLAVYLVAGLVAAFAAGLAGFAFGLIAAAAWLHVLTPLQATPLLAAFALLVQGVAVWRLRHAIRLPRLWPFLLGGALGVPLGAELLRWADADALRRGVGALLVLFAGYNLARPNLPTFGRAGVGADGAIGVLNGALGGSTGLGGIAAAVWCALRGWPRDEQRAVFQPAAVAVFAATLLWLGGAGEIDRGTAALFAAGLPAVLAGVWLGLAAYGRLDEAGFRRAVLWLLLTSGALLVLR